ncbi:hypothetical protein GE09DRAFT_1130075 [Coniochaeta sp. 2T2.1]|nr:hypothetical protein GE09DRAFT_1130075 [Coniochaeta sp. 2T2.1]
MVTSIHASRLFPLLLFVELWAQQSISIHLPREGGKVLPCPRVLRICPQRVRTTQSPPLRRLLASHSCCADCANIHRKRARRDNRIVKARRRSFG